MIPDDNIGLLEAARAIAAGRRVDWASIESGAEVSESLAALLRELRVVEDIAELHRSLPEPSADDSRVSSLNAETAAAIADAATWGPLRLLERVGEGAFGEVYRAWDPRLDREVALKLLKRARTRPDPVEHDSGADVRVIDEGRLLARVRHPNVVTVHGADRIDDRVGLWMEFVRGRTLEAVLRDHGPFGAHEAVLIGLDLCRALSAVHRAGLIHRDVKAQNVMRESGGRLVLMDFGTGREDLGGPTELAGTPLYLAPEVFAGEPASARSDIYSVGVLLYHLVTGAYPVKGRTVADLREAHGQRKRSWLRDDRPDLPDRFVQAVERALEIDPDQRYESAGAMESALARVVSAVDSAEAQAAVPAPAASASAEPSTVRRIDRRLLWVAGASLAMAALVTAVVAPPAWRGRLLGGGGASRPAQSGAGTSAAESSVAVRRVTLPKNMLVGAPSLDGTLFSVVDPEGNVALVTLSTGALRRVTTDGAVEGQGQFAEYIAIAPDNQSVAYSWSALDGKYELRVSDVDGKMPRVLMRSDAVAYPIPIQWSHDGKSVLASLERPDHTWQLALVEVESGAVRVLKDTGAARPQFASLSPDGEFVVYDAPQQPSAYVRDIFIVRSDGSDDRRLIEHPANDANPVWTPDGQRVLFTSDRSGTLDVWGVNMDRGLPQGEARLVHANLGRMTLRGLTNTGSYFYNATVGDVDVYQAALTQDAVKNPVTVAPSFAGSNISSIYSQDGRRLAYTSRRGLIGFDRGSTTVAVRDLQTQDQHEFVPALNGGFLLRAWSPDGRYLLAGGSDTAGRQGVYAIDADSGRVSRLMSSENVLRPEWLPDGRLLYANQETGTLVARSVQTGAEEILDNLKAEGFNVTGGLHGRGFKISPDGQTLAFTSLLRSGDTWTRRLGVKPLGNGGAVRELARATEPDMIMFQDWTPDGAAVLFTRWVAKPGAAYALWRVSIYGGDPQPLGLSMPSVRDVSVHPNGAAITFTSGYPQHELWVMEHFLTDK